MFLKLIQRLWERQIKMGNLKGSFFFLSFCYRNENDHWEDVAIPQDKISDVLGSVIQEKNTDVYFCCNPFSDPQRQKRYCLGSSLLWADLDEAPTSMLPEPLVLWESSPGRTQGLWKAPKWYDPNRIEAYNEALTYQIKADPSGWDLPQVLRVPGSINYKPKYKKSGKYPKGKILHKNFKSESINVKALKTNRLSVKVTNVELPEELPDRNKLLYKARKTLKGEDYRTLIDKHPPQRGKRSEVFWRLVRTLGEEGFSLVEIYVLIKESVWNKFRGRSDEEQRLLEACAKSEIKKRSGKSKTKQKKGSRVLDRKEQKESKNDDSEDEDSERTFSLVSFDELMSSLDLFPGWLIRDIWMKNSYGMIGGEPKTFKTTLALEAVVSVASGKKFLDIFEVEQKGPVLIIQNENAPWIIKDRLQKIMTLRNLSGKIETGKEIVVNKWPRDLPIYFINGEAVLLDDPLDQELIREAIKRINPILVIFDPLYQMITGNFSDARDMQPVLSFLQELNKRFTCSIMVIHHKHKSQPGNIRTQGQQMAGSTVLHGWVESAWYVVKEDNKDKEGNTIDPSTNNLKVYREFRGAPSGEVLSIRITSNNKLGYHCELVDEDDYKKSTIEIIEEGKEEILWQLKTEGPLGYKQLKAVSGIPKTPFKKCINALLKSGEIKYTGSGNDARVYELMKKPKKKAETVEK